MAQNFKLYYTPTEDPTEVLKVYFINRLQYYLRKNFASAVRRELPDRIYLDLPFSCFGSVVKPVLKEFTALYLPQGFEVYADIVDVFTSCECTLLEIKYSVIVD